MKTQLFFALAFATLPISSCDDPVEDMKPINIDSKSQELVHADNEFGIDVFKLLNETEQNNFTISPLSISLALAMTYNGAEGETKIAMEEALRVSGFTKEEINLSYKGLMNALLSADGRVTLEIAQSIWYRLNFNVLDNFKTLNQTYYDAEVNELDFGRSDAKDIINGWIEDHTHDKIKDMINSVDPLHVMFLVNAIYFNGEWRTKFNKEDTRKQNFTKEDGTVIQADMMQRKGTINYFSNDVFSAIEMPYGRGNFNMVVLLPNEGKKCNDVVEILTAEKWSEWMDMFGLSLIHI